MKIILTSLLFLLPISFLTLGMEQGKRKWEEEKGAEEIQHKRPKEVDLQEQLREALASWDKDGGQAADEVLLRGADINNSDDQRDLIDDIITHGPLFIDWLISRGWDVNGTVRGSFGVTDASVLLALLDELPTQALVYKPNDKSFFQELKQLDYSKTADRLNQFAVLSKQLLESLYFQGATINQVFYDFLKEKIYTVFSAFIFNTVHGRNQEEELAASKLLSDWLFYRGAVLDPVHPFEFSSQVVNLLNQATFIELSVPYVIREISRKPNELISSIVTRGRERQDIEKNVLNPRMSSGLTRILLLASAYGATEAVHSTLNTLLSFSNYNELCSIEVFISALKVSGLQGHKDVFKALLEAMQRLDLLGTASFKQTLSSILVGAAAQGRSEIVNLIVSEPNLRATVTEAAIEEATLRASQSGIPTLFEVLYPELNSNRRNAVLVSALARAAILGQVRTVESILYFDARDSLNIEISPLVRRIQALINNPAVTPERVEMYQRISDELRNYGRRRHEATIAERILRGQEPGDITQPSLASMLPPEITDYIRSLLLTSYF